MHGNGLPAHGALSGVRIADFTWLAAGPYGTQLLSFLGAEVIRFESRKRMDSYRRTSSAPGVEGRSRALLFNDVNLNKMSLTVDLSTPEGLALALEVVRISDVVADNFSPGVMQRLGLGYERLRRIRPDIIVISSSACGSAGPEARVVGYAPTFSALAGWGHLMGFPDMPPAEIGRDTDLRVGSAGAFSILAALHYRESTGRGQFIDLSAREALTCSIGALLLESQLPGRSPMRQANRKPGMAPH
ncbi:MAG: CoA transferase, partial [Chloroflexota bacterium]